MGDFFVPPNPLPLTDISLAIVNDTKNKYYNFSQQQIKDLCFNELSKPKNVYSGYGIPEGEDKFYDKETLYSLNSKFYRSPEFQKNVDILYSGCSVTYGMGLPEDFIWGTVVANKLNNTYANISMAGISVEEIVSNIYSYFKEYGHPKILMCLFPNFERMRVPVNNNIFISKNFIHNKEKILQELHLSRYAILEDRPKYSKAPYFAEDVLPLELAYWTSLKSIMFLEQYCEAAGIKFVWSTWMYSAHDAVKKLNTMNSSYYNGFVDIENNNWESDSSKEIDNFHLHKYELNEKCACIFECHKEMSELKHFNLALDREHGHHQAHFGSHRHRHYADLFLDALRG